MPSIRLPDDLVNDAKRSARENGCSVSQQIERWFNIGMAMATKYPHLSYEEAVKAGLSDNI